MRLAAKGIGGGLSDAMFTKGAADAWRRWVEPWYMAYALLGASAEGVVPLLLPLAVYRSSGTAYVGWVMLPITWAGSRPRCGASSRIAIACTAAW